MKAEHGDRVVLVIQNDVLRDVAGETCVLDMPAEGRDE
jgi:hypothetical protein